MQAGSCARGVVCHRVRRKCQRRGIIQPENTEIHHKKNNLKFNSHLEYLSTKRCPGVCAHGCLDTVALDKGQTTPSPPNTGAFVHSAHNAHFTRRNWGILGQLAIFLPIQTMLQPHNPMFHPTPTPQASQGPELQP